MSESLQHQDLVKLLANEITTMVGDFYSSEIQVDLIGYEKPSMMFHNFIPDAYFKNESRLIIGEAKSHDDFLRDHSLSQYGAYINECEKFNGDSTLIISIPWDLFYKAKNHFNKKKINNQLRTKIVIIADNGAKVVL